MSGLKKMFSFSTITGQDRVPGQVARLVSQVSLTARFLMHFQRFCIETMHFNIMSQDQVLLLKKTQTMKGERAQWLVRARVSVCRSWKSAVGMRFSVSADAFTNLCEGRGG